MIKNTSLKIDVVVNYTSLLAEGPVWDNVQKCICWIDILNGKIHQFSPDQQKFTTLSINQMIGSFAVCTDNNFIVALQNGFAFLDRENGAIKMITDPERHLPGNRFNDGKCDPAGRFWAGTMSLSEDAGIGSVYVLQNDLQSLKIIESVTISNGMAWSLDHKTFYYIDTPTLIIVAYDYNNVNGHISNKRTIIKIDEKEGFPDGMTIDNEGMLWVAHWGGWQIARWNPDTGEKIHSFKLPVAKVTSCTFGGDNLEDLYITTAKVGLTDEELKQQPFAGSLFVIHDCGFKGIPAVEFLV